MSSQTFDNRSELDIMTLYIFEELIKLVRIIDIIIINDSHSIVFDTVLFQQIDAFHHLIERWQSLAVAAIFVVELLWTVDRNADQEIILFEEPAPIVRQQSPVRLDAVVNSSSPGITLLQLQGFLIETDGAHQSLSSVPCKQDILHGLAFHVFLDELFQ